VEGARAAGGAEPGAEASGPLSYGQVIQGMSALIAPATLLTGISFYFGWQRVRAFDAYFGLNPGAVGYSTRDYVLNSLDALFLPVMVVLLVLIALALAHAYVGRVHREGRNPKTLRLVSELGLWFGGLLLAVGGVGAFGAFPFHTPYLIATLFPAGGVVLLAYAVDLRARLRGNPPVSQLGRVFVALFVSVCLFWAAGLYAGTVGRNQAADLARNLDELPGVTMSGTTDLVSAAGGGETTGGTAGASAERKVGFRLLAVENGTLFLLPNHWKPKSGRLVTVAEADAKGLAFTPGTVHGSSAIDAAGTGEPVASGGGGGVVYGSPRTVGPLEVRIDESPHTADLIVVNRSRHTVTGVTLTATFAKPVKLAATGASALCDARPGRFHCRLDAIPPRKGLALQVSLRANAYARGKLSVRAGPAERVLTLVLSS
jgi:hypothetical protein